MLYYSACLRICLGYSPTGHSLDEKDGEKGGGGGGGSRNETTNTTRMKECGGVL